MRVRSDRVGRQVGLAGALLALALAASARADIVELRSGGRLDGVVVQQTDQAVVIEASPGRVSIPRSQVVRVTPSRSALQTWRERASTLSGRDVQAWVALARWAEDNGLGTQARESWQRVLAASPGNADANEALHRVQLNGRWVPQEEAYHARGWVNYDGDWMSPAEHEARVRERAAANAEEQQRREAMLRMKEAEARVREAEARARSAESAGGVPGDGYGGGYGSGGGIYAGGAYGGYTGTALGPYYGNPNDAFYADAFYGNYPWGSYLNYGVPRLRGRRGFGGPGLAGSGFGFGGGFVTPFPRSVPPSTIGAPLAPAPALSPRQRGTLIIGPTKGPAAAGMGGPAVGGVGAGARH